MAIELEARIHPSAAVAPVAKAYLLIDRAEHHRIMGTLTLHLIVFGSKEERDKARAAVADAAIKAQALMDATALARPGAKNNNEAEVMRCRYELHMAQTAASSVHTIQPLGLPLSVEVPPKVIASCLTDGNADVSKCYAWLATQDGYNGAEV